MDPSAREESILWLEKSKVVIVRLATILLQIPALNLVASTFSSAKNPGDRRDFVDGVERLNWHRDGHMRKSENSIQHIRMVV